MKKLLLLTFIFSFLTTGHSFAQKLYVDYALSTSFPKTFDSGTVLSLRFHVVSDSFIPGEYVNMNYRIKNSPIDTSTTFIGSFATLTTGDSAIVTDPYFIIEPDSKFFVGDDIVVIWPTGSGGIALVGDSIIDSVHVTPATGIIPLLDNKFSIALYPDPTGGLLYLNYNKQAIHLEQVKIYDLLGRTVLTKTSSLFTSIEISSLPVGFYFLYATASDESQYIRQFVKTR